jgi:hypothetical protein
MISCKGRVVFGDQDLLHTLSSQRLMEPLHVVRERDHKEAAFAKKLGPKMLRFSAVGIQKYLATRK